MTAPLANFVDSSTIAAVATAPGRSAIAVVRVSGPAVQALASRIIAGWPIPARAARYAAVHDPESGDTVDRVVVTFFAGPRSYTGEDLLEIATHGGIAAPAAVMDVLLRAGVRLAEPGEFTRRAVLNGRLDIAQAEATGDLVDATSSAMRAAALSQVDGGLSRRIAALRDAIIECEALIAYDIDFPEEDDGPISRDRVRDALMRTTSDIEALLATAPVGAALRDGVTVVIAGPPNAGKSSLFNALLGEARAIVTPVPGTTRDAIDAMLDTRPFPLRLVDTAGLRDATDDVERLGIEVSARWLERAAVVLACGEDDDAIARTVRRVRESTIAPIVEVGTKSDVAAGGPPHREGTTAPENPGTETARDEPRLRVAVSAESGEGLHGLIDAIQRVVQDSLHVPPADVPVLLRARHQHALATALAELHAFRTAWSEDVLPATVAAVHLRAAVAALDDVIGAVGTEDVLSKVFSTFCVGK